MASKLDKSAVLILLIPTVILLVLVALGLVAAIISRDARSIAVMVAVTVAFMAALLTGFRQARRARRDASSDRR